MFKQKLLVKTFLYNLEDVGYSKELHHIIADTLRTK